MLQNIIRLREQRTVLDLVEETFEARFETILPAAADYALAQTHSRSRSVASAYTQEFTYIFSLCRTQYAQKREGSEHEVECALCG